MKRLTAKREKEIRYGRDFNVQQLAEILEELDATRADLRKAQGKPGTPVMKVDADAQSKLLRRLGLRRLSVRPIHPETDPKAQDDFKKTSQPKSRKSCRTTPKASPSSSGSRTKHGLDKKER